MNILITGKPGVGKTTLIHKVLKKFDLICQGFYTREIRTGAGNRIGFEIVTSDGKTAVLAHSQKLTPYKVGKYFVNLDNVHHIIVPCIENAMANAQLIIIDEIGKMELLSSDFQKSVLNALNSPNHVLATITMAEMPIVKKIKSRTDVFLIPLKRDNHKEIFQLVIDLLTEK